MTPAPRQDGEIPTQPRQPLDPLEVMVRDIWQGVLGGSIGSVTERFSALGGTPEQAARMLAEVERACGRPAPPAAHSADVTIAALAELMKAPESAAGRARKYIGRNLNAGPDQRPELFLMHGDMNGGGFYCLALAGHLGKDQPVHAFAPLGVDGRPLPPTIEDMVAEPLAELRRLRPRGPYRLAGYCNGGLVAYEMARALVAEGEVVERLILIAPNLPGARLPEAGWTVERIRNGIQRRVRGLLRRGPAPPEAAPAAEMPLSLFERYRRIMRGYRPGRFTGPLAIFWPAEEPYAMREGASRAWLEAAPQAVIRQVPGAHLTAITTHVAALGGAVRACLDGKV